MKIAKKIKINKQRLEGLQEDNENNKDIEVINLKLEEIQQDIKNQSEIINEIYKMLKFNTDRQYYFNAFHNPELLKLEKHIEGDILLCGNYGDPNLGDEWMLETILSYLKDKTTAHVTIMLQPNRTFDTSVYVKYGVDYIHYPQTIYDYDILVNKFDTLIFGGGAIIEDDIYWDAYDWGVQICRTLVDLSLRFFAKDKKVFCIGLSTSEKLTNREYIDKLQKVINNATIFSVRDTNSIETLEKAGINCSKVRLVNDIVYGNKCLRSNVFEHTDKEIHSIGIVYIVNDYTKQSLTLLIENINRYIKNVEISLIPFYDSWHHDIRYYNEISQNFDNVKVDSFDIGLSNTIDKFKEHDMIISMRYHGVLLSLLMGIKTVCIYFDNHPHYYNKIDYLLKQFGYDISKAISESEINNYENNITDSYLISFDRDRVFNILDESREQLENIFYEL